MADARYSRQSFLGANSDEMIEACVVGIVGLGGGGSHIVQQLAHVGFRHYVLYDPDCVEDSNLNRLVGATEEDAAHGRPKIHVAKRTILGLQPGARIQEFQSRWQENSHPLRGCDIILGCVDGFAERRELEACARRYLIPYIDIGLDVFRVGDEPPALGGQVILSMPGEPCLTCMGFLSEAVLAREAARYGDAGPRPQVVWGNGVLSSTAVGVAVDLLTGWTGAQPHPVYLSYRGNGGTVEPHIRLQYLGTPGCPHYPPDQVGDPVFQVF